MFSPDALTDYSAEARKIMVVFDLNQLKKKLKRKLPWYRFSKSVKLTKAQRAKCVSSVIRYQRQHCRKDPSRPNDLKELNLSKYELVSVYESNSEVELITSFGIMKDTLRLWIEIESYDENPI